MPASDLARQLQAANAAGHHDVGENGFERACFRKRRESSCRIRGVDYVEAESSEHLASQRRDLDVVLDQQYVATALGDAGIRRKD